MAESKMSPGANVSTSGLVLVGATMKKSSLLVDTQASAIFSSQLFFLSLFFCGTVCYTCIMCIIILRVVDVLPMKKLCHVYATYVRLFRDYDLNKLYVIATIKFDQSYVRLHFRSTVILLKSNGQEMSKGPCHSTSTLVNCVGHNTSHLSRIKIECIYLTCED